jgi:hypothetical protein
MVEIYFKDLIPEKQIEVLELYGYKHESDGNFEIMPLAILEYEGDED